MNRLEIMKRRILLLVLAAVFVLPAVARTPLQQRLEKLERAVEVTPLESTRFDEKYELVHLPIMMLTAKGSEIDKVQGLESGADDYLAKPFGMMELVARVRALYRRAQASTVAPKAPNELHCNGIDLDMDAHTCTVQGRPVKLTVKEFDLLRMLISHVGHALSRAQLFETVWGESFVGHSRTVDVHVQTLRQKLDRACSGVGKNIETVHGIGYRMRA